MLFVPSNVVPDSVTVQVLDAAPTRPLPAPQELVYVSGLLVYATGSGLDPAMPEPVNVRVSAPVTTAVYVNVNDVLPFAGVTVTDEVPDDPTLGVIVPPWEPSEMVTVLLPLNVPDEMVTVKVEDALSSYPVLGPLTE
jgi:hypothetical protein